jgi:hypothetical protein
MSLCTVAELRSALGVGTLYPDATLQESCDAADAVLLPMLWRNENYAVAHSKTTTSATLYFDVEHSHYVGESVIITNCGSAWNGTKTITSTTPDSITYTIAAATATDKNPLAPYGLVAGDSTVDWTVDSAIQLAALSIAVDIWQARQTTSSGGVAVDFQPSPWKMGSSLLARVRGLIAHALDPRSMVG